MQTLGTPPVNTIRSAGSYVSMATTTSGSAIPQVHFESATVRLSDEAREHFTANQDRVEEKSDDSGKSPADFFKAVADESRVEEAAGATDPMQRLEEMLEEALERLKYAQHQMTLAMMEVRNATDSAEKMAALEKVQAAQLLLLAAQGEVLAIHEQINKLISEQQKNS